MAIVLKSSDEIDAIARAGAALWKIIHAVSLAARPGMTTNELDQIAEQHLHDASARPILKGYVSGSSPPFPSCSCMSVNEEVVHSIPGPRTLRVGDMLSVDLAASFDGWCVDSAQTVLMPGASARSVELADAGRRAVALAIAHVKPGVQWSVVAAHVAAQVRAAGFSLVRGYDGHGIGRKLHESPRAWLHETQGNTPAGDSPDFTLWPGMVFTIEPVLAAGSGLVRTRADGWTVETADGSWATHEERTVAVVANGCRVLTGTA